MQVSRAEGPRPRARAQAQVETTHWSNPAHSYGKVVAGLAMVDAAGRAVSARKQVEVLSARGPGVLRVLRASHTHSVSSTHHHFDDLQLSVNPLNVSPQKDRSNVARSGALSGRRPPSRVRGAAPAEPAAQPAQAVPTSEPIAPDAFRLLSPSIVASGTNKLQRNDTTSSDFNIIEMKSESDDRSVSRENGDASISTYKVNFPDNNSEDSFYDSCPEKESIFKDETEQLEEWRRTSKIRRSLQFPRRSTALSTSKPVDLPDNWGSVSRIKQELENCQRLITFPNSVRPEDTSNTHHSFTVSSSSEHDGINDDSLKIMDSVFGKDLHALDNFTIKPSTLKTKTFITLETLNDVRGRLKSLSENVVENGKAHGVSDTDDGFDAEDNSSKAEESFQDPVTPASNVRSYVFGMEAKLNSSNDYKQAYSCGTNSLESRVSKLTNSSTNRNEDWYARRKSYGFEKVQNNQKNVNNTLSSHDKDYIESSTDSGICRSSELVNSLSSCNMVNSESPSSDLPKSNSSRTLVMLGNSEKKETFEDWLQQNRKTFSSNVHNERKKYMLDGEIMTDDQHSDQNYLKIPIKPEDSSVSNNNRQTFYRKLSEGKSLNVDQDLTSSKRHTIAVDAIKDIKEIYEPKTNNNSVYNLFSKFEDQSEDVTEKKGKKVEFCKTEVHFAAESGRVNIVETDGKPPSTNNFRRRRRNNSITAVKEADKSKLPVMHFGDSENEKVFVETSQNVDSSNENLKLNYAVITEIKSTPKEPEKQPIISENSNFAPNIGDDVSEGDQPRGILKNKPLKPRPYHLGEDRQIVPETNGSDQNLWGVKLRPVSMASDTPLWRSSVSIKNTGTDETSSQQILHHEKQDRVQTFNGSHESNPLGEKVNNVVNKQPVGCNINKSNRITDKTFTENKGYHTKVNIGNGDPFIETSCNPKDKKTVEDCLVYLKPTLITLPGKKSTKDQTRKCPNVTTKITIDVSSPKVNNSEEFSQSVLPELKSTSLVINSVSKAVSDRMVLIEKSGSQDIKTALKSKLSELRKLYDSKETSEDSADEEVYSLMSRGREDAISTVSHSWSKLRAYRNLHQFTRPIPSTSPFTNPPNAFEVRSRKAINIGNIAQVRRIDDQPMEVKKPFDEGKYFGTDLKHSTVQNKKSPTEKHFSSGEKELKNIHRFGDDNFIKKTGAAINDRMTKSYEESRPSTYTTFADSINTPRSLMPARGSARKLKDHEFSYFGIKAPETKEPVVNKSITNVEYVKESYKSSDSKQRTDFIEESKIAVNKTNREPEQPIYENIETKQTPSSKIRITKAKHPGETIIEELTKAADEILSALNGYSDEESLKLNSTDEDDDGVSRKNGKNFIKSIGLETISENNTQRRRSKALENKAVQTSFIRERHSHSTTNHKSKMRTSSNSSIESVTREPTRVVVSKKKSPTLEIAPEKPVRKKVSSGDVVKARRLQRANSRDALLQIHGSSSEDLAGQMEVVRKKLNKRSKQGEIKKSSSKSSLNNQESSSLVIEYSSEQSKTPSKSISSALPEIRHKTAVSTIKSINDKHSSKDRTLDKLKHSSKERSRHREKIREGTISSQSKERPSHREKSRSADPSLDRENTYSRDKNYPREIVYRKSSTRPRDKSAEGERSKKKAVESSAYDVDKKKKTSTTGRTSGSTGANQLEVSVPRSSGSSRTAERQARLQGRVSGTRTERDRSLR